MNDRVVIVTGAGRGLGRAHALALAADGAAVVVNDLGGSVDGAGFDRTPAQEVVQAIEQQGGRALASSHDISDWEGAGELIESTLQAFGRLDAVVNNAGILRDRTLANMSSEEWDDVIRVHLRGHAATSAHAMAHWRALVKAGEPVRASLIHTSSLGGFYGAFGQANYCAAKAGIIGLSAVAALEGAAIGVRSNVISPSARTRISLSTPGLDLSPPEHGFDELDPANVSPLVVWLARPECPLTGQVMQVRGTRIWMIDQPRPVRELRNDARWTVAELEQALAGAAVAPVDEDAIFA